MPIMTTGSAVAERDRVPLPRAFRDRRDELELRLYHRTRDPIVRNALIERWMPLARSIAYKHSSKGEPAEDLMQVAYEGLIKAIDRYDPARAVRFSTYGTQVISGGLKHHFRDRTQMIHINRGLRERTGDVRRAADEIREESGREALSTEIAERIRATVHEVDEALAADDVRVPASLDKRVAHDDSETAATMADLIGLEDDAYDRVEADLAVASVELDARERTILVLRFEHSLTQSEIGARIGCSQMQVSRLLRRALGKLLAAVQGEQTSPARVH